jgi:hypothetical protein
MMTLQEKRNENDEQDKILMYLSDYMKCINDNFFSVSFIFGDNKSSYASSARNASNSRDETNFL